MEHTDETVAIPIASVVKCCPCCASRGVLTQTQGKSKFGVQCNGCPLTFPEVYSTPESAITAWSLRRGTISAAGGRGTRNRCSSRKRRSCKRNLRLARQKKRLKQVRANLLITIPWFRTLRAYERAESSEEKARARASLKAMEPQIMSIPSLRPFYKLIRQYAP